MKLHGLFLGFILLSSVALGEKSVAIFTTNRAEAEYNEYIPILEDYVIANLSDSGFEIISRDIALGTARNLMKKTVKDEILDFFKKDEAEDVNRLLEDKSSILRLSQNLGANYILYITFAGIDLEVKNVRAYGVEYQNSEYRVNCTYRVLDGNTGGSLISGMVEPTKVTQTTSNSSTTYPTGVVRELLSLASSEMSNKLNSDLEKKSLKTVELDKRTVTFSISASIQNLSFPQVVISDEGKVSISEKKSPVDPTSVSVSIDGLVIGSAGSDKTTFQISPGIHTLSLSSENTITVERMINVYDGMVLDVPLRFTDEALKKWEDKIKLFDDLSRKAQLTQAEVSIMLGEAEQLKNSGYKVDIKVDTDEGIDIEKKTLF